MTSVDVDIIRKKLGIIIENLKALEPLKNIERSEYDHDLYKRKAAERLVQELIDAAIDINTYIIVQTGNPAPDDYFTSFLKAGDLNIISSDLAEKLAPSAGLRNRLVHEYDAIDNAMVMESIRSGIVFYRRFVEEIELFLERL